MTHKGLLFVLIGPSGSGKNTIIDALLHDPSQHLRQLPTATTRDKRATEVDGVQHYFISVEAFEQLIQQDALVEYQKVHQTDYYGMPRSEIEKLIANGESRLADLDIYGAQTVKAAFPDNVVLIFVSPPDHATLEARVRARQTEEEATIQRRLARADMEMNYAFKTDYVVINDNLDESIRLVSHVITICKAQGFDQDIPLLAQAWITAPHDPQKILTINGKLPRLQVKTDSAAPYAMAACLYESHGLVVESQPEHPYHARWCHQWQGKVVNEIIVPMRAMNVPEHLRYEWVDPEMLEIPFPVRMSLATPEPTF